MPDSPTLAVVIPVYNEQEHILPLLEDWLPVFKATGASFRVIFINDGSTDQGPARLRGIREEEA
jgi:polyisoprenyl-phosphate glycosyltransferase